MKSLFRLFSGKQENKDQNTCNFTARQKKEEAYEAIERGTLEVPIDRIVGSVGRYHDFDHQFKTSSHRHRDERLEGILNALRAGKILPPIALYQIKDDYFILDGHHRFTAARELGHTHIRSKIVELLPSKNTLENNLYIEKTQFRDYVGLKEAPTLTELGQYGHLIWQIREHHNYLKKEKSDDIEIEQAAADWYTTIYMPLYTLIENSGLVKNFPGRNVDDLYLYISFHQWEEGKKRQYGRGFDKLIPTDMEEFRRKMAQHTEQEYPEMKREITVFMLLTIEGKYEQAIFDKLLALEEIREVHTVHGSFDLLIKITLLRDLLSSDAELISHFTQATIRQWKGVLTTQTLIPGMSIIKDNDRCYL